MPRSIPPLRLGDSPLVFVLARAGFSPVLEMDRFIPAIQGRMRKNGFPGFAEEVAQNVAFGPGEPVLSSKAKRWLFLSEDRHTAVVLGTDFVVLETSEYAVFDEFAEQLTTVLQIVGDIAELGQSETLGLRYVDLIRTSDRLKASDHLQPGLRGPDYSRLTEWDLEPGTSLRRLEVKTPTPLGSMALRVFQFDDGTFLPPDIVARDLEFDVDMADNEVVTVLDIDHISRQRQPFEPDLLIETAWEVHDYTDAAFRSVVTEDAMADWSAEAI